MPNLWIQHTLYTQDSDQLVAFYAHKLSALPYQRTLSQISSEAAYDSQVNQVSVSQNLSFFEISYTD